MYNTLLNHGFGYGLYAPRGQVLECVVILARSDFRKFPEGTSWAVLADGPAGSNGLQLTRRSVELLLAARDTPTDIKTVLQSQLEKP